MLAVAWWEGVVAAAMGGGLACIMVWFWIAAWTAERFGWLMTYHPWPLVGIVVCCVVMAWGLSRALASEARVGMVKRAAALTCAAVGWLLVVFEMKRGMLFLPTIVAGCVGLVWLASYLCSRAEGWWQSFKVAWRVCCMAVMWWCSVACLYFCALVLWQTVSVVFYESAGSSKVISAERVLPENEGKVVCVKGSISTGDVLELPEWGVRMPALYLRVIEREEPTDDPLRSTETTRSARNFTLGAYHLPEVDRFEYFTKEGLTGVEIPWPPPNPLPASAVTALPHGWQEVRRVEYTNALYLDAEQGGRELYADFTCYLTSEKYSVVVRGRQRGEALENVTVLRAYGEASEQEELGSEYRIGECSWIFSAVLMYLLALISYLIGGAKAHSPLMFGRPVAGCVFVGLLIACCVTQAIALPCMVDGSYGGLLLVLMLTAIGICMNFVVHNARRQ